MDCYGCSIDSAFFAIMPGTKDSYLNPDINGVRVDFENNTVPTWNHVTVNATYNETTAPTASNAYLGVGKKSKTAMKQKKKIWEAPWVNFQCFKKRYCIG